MYIILDKIIKNLNITREEDQIILMDYFKSLFEKILEDIINGEGNYNVNDLSQLLLEYKLFKRNTYIDVTPEFNKWLLFQTCKCFNICSNIINNINNYKLSSRDESKLAETAIVLYDLYKENSDIIDYEHSMKNIKRKHIV